MSKENNPFSRGGSLLLLSGLSVCLYGVLAELTRQRVQEAGVDLTARFGYTNSVMGAALPLSLAAMLVMVDEGVKNIPGFRQRMLARFFLSALIGAGLGWVSGMMLSMAAGTAAASMVLPSTALFGFFGFMGGGALAPIMDGVVPSERSVLS